MKPDSEQNDRELFSRLGVRKPDEFWEKQRADVMKALPERRTARQPLARWQLAPVLAALLIAAAWLFRHEKPLPAPQQNETQMLEHLDMLDNMDLLERIPDKELI
ncbi:MAG: hypothetical protein GX410_06325 [Elusimicrobia bacterium]|nr:hypothetical protein [Elusimicrobiota bacterium]